MAEVKPAEVSEVTDEAAVPSHALFHEPQDEIPAGAVVRSRPERLEKALAHARLCARIASDNRAKDVLLLDLRVGTPLVDFFVIASTASRRQAYAVADELDQERKKRGERKLGIEGAEEARWILIDYGDFVVHVFAEDARSYYSLEEIWGDAPRLEWKDEAAGVASRSVPISPTNPSTTRREPRPMNVLETLRSAFSAATPPGGDAAAFAAAVRPSTDPKFGDYQANGCMALANRAKKNPRELAGQVAAAVDLAPLAGPPEVAGPGFLNIRLRDDWISEALGTLLTDPHLGLSAPATPQTVVIDFSSPNVAKPMHVGHIRSTVIGDSLSRMFAALGHKVIRDNHLGDWGTQFGMIIWGWKNHRDEASFGREPVAELTRLYRLTQALIKPADEYGEKLDKVGALRSLGQDAEADVLFLKLLGETGRSEPEVVEAVSRGRAVSEAARAETAKLHSGDAENRALWERFMPHCLGALHTVYERLGVTFDVELGESYYNPMLPAVVADLESRGLAVPSEGATVVFTEASRAPFLVRKSDGAFTYATTDLATIRHRVDTWHPDQALYVVDQRQSDHFRQLFEVARRWGYDGLTLAHIAFGTILDPPTAVRSRPARGTRSASNRSSTRPWPAPAGSSTRTAPTWTPEERQRVAEVVGLGRDQVHRPQPSSDERLRLRLEQDDGDDGQHGGLSAIRLRPHPEHLPEG